jgi:hypothetical protein
MGMGMGMGRTYSSQFVTTPGIASFLAGGEGLGASYLQQQQQQQQAMMMAPSAASSIQEMARFFMQQNNPEAADPSSSLATMMPLGGAASTGGVLAPSSLFGGNARWSTASPAQMGGFSNGAIGPAPGPGGLAAQANATFLTNLNGVAAASTPGGINDANANSAAAAGPGPSGGSGGDGY